MGRPSVCSDQSEASTRLVPARLARTLGGGGTNRGTRFYGQWSRAGTACGKAPSLHAAVMSSALTCCAPLSLLSVRSSSECVAQTSCRAARSRDRSILKSSVASGRSGTFYGHSGPLCTQFSFQPTALHTSDTALDFHELCRIQKSASKSSQTTCRIIRQEHHSPPTRPGT